MHLADTGSDRHDVLGIGNAIVDILAYAEDDLVAELELARGAMTLIDEERSAFLYRRLGPAREVSGGSCANTIAAVAVAGRPRRLSSAACATTSWAGCSATTSAPPASPSATRPARPARRPRPA